MAGRRTNLALMMLLAVAAATGALAWAIGTPAAGAIVVAHGVAGLAIVVLAPWKGAIARRGLRRPRDGRLTSLTLAGLVVACVVSGVVHASGFTDARGTLSAVGVHVATGLVALVVGAVHVVQRPTRPRTTDVTRRNLVRAAAVAAAGAGVFAAFEGLLRASGARGAERRFTGSHEAGSFHPERMPVTQWLDDDVPVIDPATWQLAITSSGAPPRSFMLDDLASIDDRVRAVLDCTGGWYAEQVWHGVRLDRLVGSAEGASVLVRSATGYARRFPMGDASAMLLATSVGGDALSSGHGFPVRLVAPGRRGFWWVKWVTEIQVDDTPWWWQPPFPVT